MADAPPVETAKSIRRFGRGKVPAASRRRDVNGWEADHIYRHEANAIEAFLLMAFLSYNTYTLTGDYFTKRESKASGG